MGKPITTATGGICFAFPDVCLTPAPPSPSPVPVPYPNIGQLSDIEDGSDNVNAAGTAVVHVDSTIADQKTTGDEAGTSGGVNGTPGTTKGAVAFKTSSTTVMVNNKGVVRMFDSTLQNNENAVGVVLGGVATVLVGD